MVKLGQKVVCPQGFGGMVGVVEEVSLKIFGTWVTVRWPRGNVNTFHETNVRLATPEEIQNAI